MDKFKIDEEYLTSVTVAYGYTQDGVDYGTTSHVDHPSFAALRIHLESRGFIKTERWWNGDIVLIPFTLNEKEFEEGSRFPSAGAQGCRVRFERNRDV